MRLVADERQRVGKRAFAIAAIVVEELDQRDVAVWVAERHLMARGKERGRVGGDSRAAIGRSLGARSRARALPLLQDLRQDLPDRLRMADEIVPDQRPDLVGMGSEIVPDDRFGRGAIVLGAKRSMGAASAAASAAATRLGRRIGFVSY